MLRLATVSFSTFYFFLIVLKDFVFFFCFVGGEETTGSDTYSIVVFLVLLSVLVTLFPYKVPSNYYYLLRYIVPVKMVYCTESSSSTN